MNQKVWKTIILSYASLFYEYEVIAFLVKVNKLGQSYQQNMSVITSFAFLGVKYQYYFTVYCHT